MKTVGFISLGCPKNQIDGECLLAQLDAAGYTVADPYDGVDVVIINTCGFIEDAKKEAIENILDMVQLKEDGTIGKIVVTGCLAERYQNEICKEIPEVDAVIGIGANKDIAAVCDRMLAGETVAEFPPKEELPLNGERVLTTPEYYAYLKIAEGCNNCCTYCAIPQIRGRFRSREMDDIYEEAVQLAEKGVKELILVAQDTTLYGKDLYGKFALPELLQKLCTIDGIHWIRMLYCYPDEFTDELIDVMASEEKVLHYVDLPLQHASNKILKRMNRRCTAEQATELIQKLRERIPDIVLRTTFITGFPGEGEEEFEELAVFVNETEFDCLGCFAYSAEEGTPAAAFEDRLDERTKNDRKEIIMNDQYSIVLEKHEALIGQTFEVLVESYDEYSDSYVGRTYRDAPDIDSVIKFTAHADLNEGDFCMVKVFGVDEYDLIGEAEE
ncbi:MAG TPA: 30S ribosomal protein S12 methylthiotransferase RimO [Ruminococcaceae bacterium]|nr:30S ribosomal protein S12 methylthiotransferase RimO [Oscillospiraceae bacterium]